MGDQPPARRSSLPHPRATTLFARTIYRELRRARYEHQDLVRFVSHFMELMTDNLRKAPSELEHLRLEGVIDPETGLPNHTTFAEILDFEIQRADEMGDGSLLLLCIDVNVPEWFSDDLVRSVHERTAVALQKPLRKNDVVARLPPNRYLVLVPSAQTGVIHDLCARFGAALRGNAEQSQIPTGTHYSVRWVVRSEPVGTGTDLLEQCSRAPEMPLGVGEAERPAASISTTSLSDTPKKNEQPKRRVVLALGGGAVRAGAHVGVIDVLQEAGVEIVGIAGTSAGALIGAMHLLEMPHDAIMERFESFTSTPLYEQTRTLYAAYMRRANRMRHSGTYFRQSELAFMSDSEMSAVPDDLFAEFIAHFVGPDRDIATLSRPFAACATDIVDGRPAHFMRGLLHQALRASCAVPGLFAPQIDGERRLVDGSTVAEVPIGAALGLHLSAPVLAVYLERPTQKVPTFSSSAEVMARAGALVQTELVREQLRSAPILLTVAVRDGGWLDFKRAHETRSVGEVVTRVALEGLLAQIDEANRVSARAKG